VNCVRTIPWVRDVANRYGGRGLSVVGIHTPEFDRERVRANVEAEVQRRGLDFPHLLDNDYAYWQALDNEYWPAIYLVDRCGRLRGKAVGEVHSGAASGRGLEEQIEALLRETPGQCGEARTR
jgi:hypothetical protein